MKKRTRLLSLLLALALCLTLLPAGISAAGSSVITLGYSGISAGDAVYFGSYDGSPIRWYVYDVGTSSATLASYSSLYSSPFHSNATTSVGYMESELYLSLQSALDFSALEQSHVSSTITLPSETMARDLPAIAPAYWLSEDFTSLSGNLLGTFYCNGGTERTLVTVASGVRPVFNLSLSNILFTQTYTSGITLTLLDSNRNFQIGTIAVDGDTLTIGYTGASVGTNEYICAMVVSNGSVTYYDTLTQPTSTTGTLDVSLTDVGYSSGCTLYLFTQQCNGERNTDYASSLQEVSTTRDATYIAYDLSNITCDPVTILLSSATNYRATLSAATDYCLPSSITITDGDGSTIPSSSYSYDNSRGAVYIGGGTLNSIDSGYITITAAAYSATQAPTITGIVAGESYCGSVEFTVTDDDLDIVELSSSYASMTESNGVYTVAWSQTGYSGYTLCTIEATDKNNNSTSVSFYLYSDHEWDTANPYWEWATDGTSATVTFYCTHDSTHTTTVTATGTAITSAETTAATAYTDGEMTYTATVSFNGASYTDSSYTAAIPALGTTTLSFDVNGGWGMNDVAVGIGETIDLTQYAATRDGYRFTGWYADSALTQPITTLTVGTSPITIYAGWEPVVYTWEIPITLTVANAASVNALPEDFTLEMSYYGGSLDLSAMDITILNGSTTISTDGAMQYTATLTFSSYVDTELDLADGFYLQLGIGNSYGWVYDDTVYFICSSFDDDTGVQTRCRVEIGNNSYQTAAFNVNFTGYTLTFQTNGGSSIANVEAGAGAPIALSAYAPTRSGYTFAGWYADAALTQAVTSVTMTSDKTVYAAWTSNATEPAATGGSEPTGSSTPTGSSEPTSSSEPTGNTSGTTATTAATTAATTSPNSTGSSPKTGDESGIGLYLLLMVASGLSLGVCYFYQKERETT